ncbi:YidB family protein [Comamonas odontotermitis]|uniref:YidB family protein n=1 Tax=Comamonas TaxID=283 RepID=UPI001CC62FC7|nr:YidB family protein [Comamonas odontotermitis]UBB16349.1 YidB family protein [Comamonas odontotermitis]
MFDTLIRDMADRFGLGDKAKDLVAMVLAYITDPANGGLSGLLDRFRSAGLGGLADSWLSTTEESRTPTNDEVSSVFGASGGLLSTLSDKLHLPKDAVTSAVGALLPALVSRLSPNGMLPATLPAEAVALIGSGKSLLGGLLGSGAAAAAGVVGAGTAAVSSAASTVSTAAASTATAAGGGIGKWLPWIIGALVVIFGISYCGKKTPDTAPAPAAPAATPAPAPEPAPVPAPAPEPAAPAPAAASAPTADAAPAGAAVIDSMVQDVPKLQVFFDTGKTEVPPEFADKSKALVGYLQSHTDVKAVVSGFNDPTGDAAKNAELSKQRAMAVQTALAAAGVPVDRTVLEKPAETSDTGNTNAASRRVDVVLRAN